MAKKMIKKNAGKARRLSDSERKDIIQSLAKGEKISAIAERIGTSVQTVSKFRNVESNDKKSGRRSSAPAGVNFEVQGEFVVFKIHRKNLAKSLFADLLG